jgi:hypothetical protein
MVRMVTVQTRECIEGDASEVVRGYYTVTDGVLTMCNEDGKPTANSQSRTSPGRSLINDQALPDAN